MQRFSKILISTVVFFVFLVSSKNSNYICESIITQETNPEHLYIMNTELGDITIKVFPQKAPIATHNFLSYVTNANFEGASFYRAVRMDNQPKDSIKIEVIQGNFIASALAMTPIEHETTETTGILHKNGVISMARAAPGTASAAFFICINDQPELDYGGKRNPDGQGFNTFGKVINGMNIVKKIQSRKTNGQSLETEVKIYKIYKKS